MNKVELGWFLKNAFGEIYMVGARIDAVRVQAQGALAASAQTGISDWVATGEERHVVAHFDESFREIGNNPLGPTI